MKLTPNKHGLTATERIIITVVSIMILVLALPSISYFKTQLIHSGYVALSSTPTTKIHQLATDILHAPIRWLYANHQLPVIMVDIDYPEWKKLADNRQQAIEQGAIPAIRAQVNAKITFNNKSFNADVRLQGDLLDHVSSHQRWSLKVDLKKQHAILDSQRFALISPHVRVHQGPVLFAQTLRLAKFNLISPKYTPVKVIVNGDDWGVMYHEQGFGQDLLATHNRTEGMILRLDLDSQQIENNHVSRQLTPRVIQQKRISRKLELNYQRQLALTLLSDFINGDRSASDVFDSQLLGQYLATVDVWGAWHALTWNNWRWYYNPHTAKLEPIQSDVAVSPSRHQLLIRPPSETLLISKTMRADPEVERHYQAALQRLAALIKSGDLQQHLNTIQHTQRAMLDSSAPLTPWFDSSLLTTQITCLQQQYRSDDCDSIKPLAAAYHLNMTAMQATPLWELASFYNHQQQLTIINPTQAPLYVQQLVGFNSANQPIAIEEANSQLPLELQPEQTLTFKLPHSIDSVEVSTATPTATLAKVRLIPHQLQTPFLPRPIKQPNLNDYPFIEVGDDYWKIPAGRWHIKHRLRTPANWQLMINAGTELVFEPQAGIMVFGQLTINGTAASPVELSASNHQPWAGVVVFSTPTAILSVLNHVNIADVGSPKQGLWRPRGAISFINTKVEINQAQIHHNHTEDALNIVNSEININHLTLSHILSDGFDCDFCRGSISNSRFDHIGTRSGGDGIDVSGSTLTLTKLEFSHIRDKAISVGEQSQITATDITISDTNIGLVGKDGSQINASNIRGRNIHYYGLMSYRKKNLFNSATVKVNNWQCTDCKNKVMAATGNSLIIDGQVVTPQKLNVSQLYNTIMKPDKPQ
ncbi:hypothetical protein CTM88_05120 [Photobacterium aquimaris]|uniref:Right handed beta helix domain-containing protein n=1 Tax=Photobacterium aquimaris TaxID=512643 RepID=A0A2T3IPZ2_9GAMM|nr:hypothetical protein [Photobacterium aquimaris]OBU17195.1 hypothetical protein AYY20_06120 [Photobacterium aquimaris]PSU30392.1 hypothetical protein CTM88_05120 [Photobacterium aquimaris]